MKTTCLEIKEVSDPEEIKAIILDDEIYDRITDDTCPKKEDYVFDSIGAQFFGGYLDGKLIGLVIHHDGEIHVNILKEYRKDYKTELVRGAFNKIDRPNVWAEIPLLFPSIIKFAEDEGFKQEKVIKDGFLKNGKTYDTVIMVKELTWALLEKL